MADTIFALSSGAGRAGVAVFRLSGSRVRDVLQAICPSVPDPRIARLRKIKDPHTGELIDTALVLFFPAPASFTGEDVAEIHLHGSLAVIRRFSVLLAQIPGLVHAQAGDFTRRAFSNGRLDFLDLESLSDLLAAETELQRKLAVEGSMRLRQLSCGWRDRLIDLCAQTEALLDFSEEEDVQFHIDSSAEQKIDTLAQEIDSVSEQVKQGERIRDGVHVAILGPPNAGKSTLLNALAGRDVAIVSPVEGTTRDIVEVHLDLDGLPVIICDTAGIRDSHDDIEREGIKRARNLAERADLCFWLSPAHKPMASPDNRFITVTTQIDRNDSQELKPTEVVGTPFYLNLAVSAKTGEGMDLLIQRIKLELRQHYSCSGAELVVAHERQAQALKRASQALRRASHHTASQLDLRAEDLRQACLHLDALTGRIQADEILGAIFSRFCIGK